MATNTTHYSMTKPDDTDFADNNPYNTNLDTIDTEMFDHKTRLTTDYARFSKVTTAQSISHNTDTKVTFNQTDYESDTALGDQANNRFVVQRAGLYRATAQVEWAGNSTNRRVIMIFLNGSYVARCHSYPSTTQTCTQQVIFEHQLAVNDVVEVYVFQASGGALDVNAGANATWFTISEVAR